jgi:SAM-dependent methyltransferase
MRFNEKNFAEEYESRLAAEGYPGNITEYVMKELAGSASIFDVGAGTGFLSIPLAENGFRVKAIDPAREMLSILERKIAGRNLTLETVNESWESFTDDQADAILSVHSIYPMKDPNYAILKMKRNADKSVIVVRKSVQDESVADIIRNRYNKKRCSQISDEDVKLILKNGKISFKADDITQTRLSRFTDINEEIDYYVSHYSLNDDDRNDIHDIIMAKTEKSGNDFFYKTVFRDCIIVF